jgi:hypothetical protein
VLLNALMIQLPCRHGIFCKHAIVPFIKLSSQQHLSTTFDSLQIFTSSYFWNRPLLAKSVAEKDVIPTERYQQTIYKV